MKNNKQYVAGLLLSAFLLVLVAPMSSEAATVATYQPKTKAEMVAYLYGRISQLLEIQLSLEKSGGNTITPAMLNYATIETREASDILTNSAILRGEVELYGKSTATVWFEYGEDEDFLDLKTRTVKVASVYDRAVRSQVTKLKDDQKYYFRMMTVDSNGVVQFGDVYDFRTDEIETTN